MMTGNINPHLDYLEGSRQQIASGDDLNNYLTVGRYTCATNAIANATANMPKGAGAGRLLVMCINDQAKEIIPGVTKWKTYLQWYMNMGGTLYVRTINVDGNGTIGYGGWTRFLKEAVV